MGSNDRFGGFVYAGWHLVGDRLSINLTSIFANSDKTADTITWLQNSSLVTPAPRYLPRSSWGHGGFPSTPPCGAARLNDDAVAMQRETPPPGVLRGASRGPAARTAPVLLSPARVDRGSRPVAVRGAPSRGSRCRGEGGGGQLEFAPGSRTPRPGGASPAPLPPFLGSGAGGAAAGAHPRHSPRLRALRTFRDRVLIGGAPPVTSAGSLPIGRPVAGTVGLPGSHLTRSAPPPRAAPTGGPLPRPPPAPPGRSQAGGAITAAGSGAAGPQPTCSWRGLGIAALSGRGGAPGVARGLGRERGDWRGGRPADTPPLEKGRREWRGEKVNTAGRHCPRTGRGGRGSAPDVMGPGAAAPGQDQAGLGAGGILSPGPCAGPGLAARAALPPRRLRAAPGGRR